MSLLSLPHNSTEAAASTPKGMTSASVDALPTLLTTKGWHSPLDEKLRRTVVSSLVRVLSTTAPQTRKAQELVILSCRLEGQLYHSSLTRQEYRENTTMRRRLKGLAYCIRAEESTVRSLQGSSRPTKRARVHFATTSPFENEMIMMNVYAFLEASDTVRHQAINHFCHATLPQCLKVLAVSVSGIRHALQSHQLVRYSHLQKLIVFNPEATMEDMDDESLNTEELNQFMRSCPNLPIRTRDRGEDVVLGLAEAVREGTFKHLQALSMQSSIINSTTLNSLPQLIAALQNGTCPNLSHLNIAGNCARDPTAVALASLLVSRACPKLMHVNARNNYIGEEGGMAFASALLNENCCPLEELCLGGNVLIDASLIALSKALLQRTGKNLRFIGLEDNFISHSGMDQLSIILSGYNIVFVDPSDKDQL